MSNYVYNPFISNFDDRGIDSGGNVVGPGSSTDDALVRWDGATGTLLKDSSAILDDGGNLTLNSISLTTNLAISDGGTNASTEAGARINLGLEIGTDVQAWDQALDDISGLAVTDGNIIVGDGVNWVAENGATARTSLGLGTISTQDSNNVSITGGSITGITDLVVADGGTGVSSFTAYAVICGGTTGTGALQSIAGVGTSGQVLTSNGAATLPTFQDASSGGITWNSIAGTTQTAAVNNAYIVANSSQTTITLPSTSAVGDIVRVAGYGAGGWIIDYGTGQLIHFLGSDSTTTSGNLTSSNRYDAVELVCTVTDTEWNVISSVGNITVN